MSQHKVGPWTVLGQHCVFENPWIRVEHHDVTQPDGSAGEYGIVSYKNRAIGVLPVSEEGDVWLVGQHRYPFDKYSWELPEGGGPKNQTPLDAAMRELKEETGLTARSWSPLSEFDVSNSVSDEQAICFLAWDLEPGPSHPEPSETLQVKTVKFAELLEMVMTGRISDSLTIIMTLTAHQRALRGEAPEPISRLLLAGRE